MFELKKAQDILQQSRQVLTLFGKETTLYSSRIPVLIVAECKIAARYFFFSFFFFLRLHFNIFLFLLLRDRNYIVLAHWFPIN